MNEDQYFVYDILENSIAHAHKQKKVAFLNFVFLEKNIPQIIL